jgi:arginine N-succinyltransferase
MEKQSAVGAQHALVRPVRLTDLDAILELTRRGGTGLTNLPPDRGTIERRINCSVQALEDEQVRAEGAAIMLVADLDGQIVATGMIFARVGAEWPFYSYRVTTQVAFSRSLARTKAQRLLNLVNDFDGETEVGGLFVDPRMRGLALGHLMARSRYLFIAAHRSWFGKRVIAELRGYQDSNGRSPVWDAIGRHFYDMEFAEADRTGAIHGNQFIADLGARYPIYVSMLPPAAQAALGRPHDDGRPAYAMLLAERFRDEGYVDIFDGGPTLVAAIDEVVSVSTARKLIYRGEGTSGQRALVSAGHAQDFRLARGWIIPDEQGVRLDAGCAETLGVGIGEMLQIVPFEARDQ